MRGPALRDLSAFARKGTMMDLTPDETTVLQPCGDAALSRGSFHLGLSAIQPAANARGAAREKIINALRSLQQHGYITEHPPLSISQNDYLTFCQMQYARQSQRETQLEQDLVEAQRRIAEFRQAHTVWGTFESFTLSADGFERYAREFIVAYRDISREVENRIVSFDERDVVTLALSTRDNPLLIEHIVRKLAAEDLITFANDGEDYFRIETVSEWLRRRVAARHRQTGETV